MARRCCFGVPAIPRRWSSYWRRKIPALPPEFWPSRLASTSQTAMPCAGPHARSLFPCSLPRPPIGGKSNSRARFSTRSPVRTKCCSCRRRAGCTGPRHFAPTKIPRVPRRTGGPCCSSSTATDERGSSVAVARQGPQHARRQGCEKARGAVAHRSRWLIVFTVLCIMAAILAPAIPQPVEYHQFADRRRALGIDNFSNVVTNAGFLVAGLAGLVVVFSGRAYFEFSRERWPWVLFFVRMLLAGVGSSYCH